MKNLFKSKIILIIFTAVSASIATLLLTIFFKIHPFADEFPREITRCGSTLPITCVTFRCEKGYIVPIPSDGPPPLPGGGSQNRTCSDGSVASKI